jgi:protein-S-isoprenylcysteine O-methyltransferase Ste14
MRRAMRPGAPATPGIHVPPPLIFVAGFTAGWLLHREWPLALVGAAAPAVRLGLGWGLVAVGLALMWTGLATFLLARTAVLPIRPATRLVTTGLYRFSRNPMYLGMTLLYIGGALVVDSLWPLALLPLVLVLLVRFVIRLEERYLAATFGEAYEEYRRRVRRWF